MTALENLTAGASVRGFRASGAATVESVQWIGEQALKVIFSDGDGHEARRVTIPKWGPIKSLAGDGRATFEAGGTK